jgi:hypothetical protein
VQLGACIGLSNVDWYGMKVVMNKMTVNVSRVLCSTVVRQGLGVRRRVVIRRRTKIRCFKVNIGNLNRQDSQIISVMLS